MNTLSLARPAAIRRLSSRVVLAGAALALVVIAFAALGHGALPMTARQVALGLAHVVVGTPVTEADAQAVSVLLQIRLPRVAMGIAAGAGLAMSGAVLQAVFRNPLADPMLIGVSSGAALAVTAVIVVGATALTGVLGALTLPIAGFAGGLAATALLHRIATREGRTSLATMLLAGIAINALAFAGVGILVTVASDSQLRSIAFWNFGSLAGAAPSVVACVMGATVVAGGALVRLAPALNALLLGDREARHLGVDPERTQRAAIALAALLAGFVVAGCGVIGFVALVAPHMVRLVAGPDHRVVVPGSALVGATLLLLADLVARTVVSPADLPIGIVTAIVGAPVFLVLLVRQRERLA